jgi:hypothetical protein
MSATFWADSESQAKRKFRFIVSWNGMPQFIAKSVTKPSFQVGSATHSFLNHNFNFPGRVTWQDVTLTLVDPINPDATYSFYRMLTESGYTLPDNVAVDGTVTDGSTISKNSMTKTLKDMRIATLDEEGKTIEHWTLNNCLFTSVNFDQLDYSSEELLNITVTVKYDWATLKKSSSQEYTSENGWDITGTPDTTGFE